MELPPGFQLDEPRRQEPAGLPAGFVLDGQEPARQNLSSSYGAGVFGGIGQNISPIQQASASVDGGTAQEPTQSGLPAWYAAAENAVNTFGLNIPRNIGAGVRSMVTGNNFNDEYDYLKRRAEEASQAHPVAAGLGTAAGALGQVAVMPEVAPAASLAGRAAQGAALGAGISGVSELADSKDIGAASKAAAAGAVLGGAATPLIEGAASAVNTAAKPFMKKPVIPTTDELKSASQAAYKAADDAGVILRPEGLKGLASDIQQTLANEGYHPKLGNQSKIGVVLDELNKAADGNVTLKGMDVIRRMAGSARMDIDPSTKRLGSMLTEKLDDYLSGLNPSQILTGNGPEAVKSLQEARSYWNTYRKSDMIDTAIEKAQLQAGSTGSGGNVENALRQQFKQMLTNPKKSAAFTGNEKAQLAKIVTGESGQNILRLLGKMSPQGNGLSLMLNVGAAGATGGASTALTALGMGAKYLAENATSKNIEKLRQMINARGMNIDPQELVKVAQADKLRNFFASIGVDVESVKKRSQQ